MGWIVLAFCNAREIRLGNPWVVGGLSLLSVIPFPGGSCKSAGGRWIALAFCDSISRCRP